MTSLNRFRNPTTIIQASVTQGPVDCLIVQQDWADKVAKIKHVDILGSNYYLLLKVIDIDIEGK